jgi:hypothetical protein
MTRRTLDSYDIAHALMSFLCDWAASDRGTSYSEQAPSGSFRRMAFRFPRKGGDDAELVLVAGLEDGNPVIQVSVANFDPFEGDKSYSEGTVGLPEPIPEEMREFIRRLEESDA